MRLPCINKATHAVNILWCLNSHNSQPPQVQNCTYRMILSLPSTILLLAATMQSCTDALPTTTMIIQRAGGPAAVPLPPSCNLTNLAPTLRQMGDETYIPSTTANNDILYAAYYPSYSTNITTMSLQCAQQCHGYGDGSQCKTAFWAEKMVVPKGYYGGSGGQLETACVLFNRTLETKDFEAAPKGNALNAITWGLLC